MITCTFEDGTKASPGLRHVVVDTLIVKNDSILLVKRTKKLHEGGKWALVGGYMNSNETLEETVARETFEETGYRIKNITLFRIIDNPNRSNEDKQNISFIFLANALEKEGETDWENDEQKWYPLTKLPLKNDLAFDHFENITLYLRHIITPFALPIRGNI